MLGIILGGAAALGLAGAVGGGVCLCCRPVNSYCWHKSPGGFGADSPCCCSVRISNDPVSAAVAYLNKPYIIDRYRGRKTYLDDLVFDGENRAYVMLRFGDGDRMGFELCRGGCVWKVCRYCYADL